MRRILQKGECTEEGKHHQGYLLVLAEVVGSAPSKQTKWPLQVSLLIGLLYELRCMHDVAFESVSLFTIGELITKNKETFSLFHHGKRAHHK